MQYLLKTKFKGPLPELSLAENIPLEVCYKEFPVEKFTKEGLHKLVHYFELKSKKGAVLKEQQWCAKTSNTDSERFLLF